MPLWAIHQVTLATSGAALPTLHPATLYEQQQEENNGLTYLEVGCKNLRIFQFVFRKGESAARCHKVLQKVCFSGDQESAFAYHNLEFTRAQLRRSGWDLFSWENEFKRMGLSEDEWRITSVNKTFEMTASYPQYFIVPKALCDEGESLSSYHAVAAYLFSENSKRLRHSGVVEESPLSRIATVMGRV